MARVSEHRIYKHMSEPFRIFGLTTDEFFCGIMGMTLGLYNMGDLALQMGFFTTGFMGVWGLKKLKSRCAGFHMQSYLYWHGVALGVSQDYPPRERRFYLS